MSVRPDGLRHPGRHEATALVAKAMGTTLVSGKVSQHSGLLSVCFPPFPGRVWPDTHIGSFDQSLRTERRGGLSLLGLDLLAPRCSNAESSVVGMSTTCQGQLGALDLLIPFS